VAMALLVAFAAAAPSGHEITALPGWSGPLPSRHYSGYLNISQTKRIHYWFVESMNNPTTDPVVVWMNGGPGCSSLDGFVYEHGPFRFSEDGTSLVRFNQSWASLANMLYIEAPVGVGFSYATDSAYACNDDQTAYDNRLAVQTFFSLFPEYNQHDLFITGESYGGIYVPTLAESILQATENGTYKGAPLKGIAVGNGCTGNEIGVCGGERDKYETEYLLGTAFVDPSLKDAIRAACDFSNSSVPSMPCQVLLNKMHNNLGNIDMYNIYGSCINGDSNQVLRAPLGKTYTDIRGPTACIDSILASNYFNRADVQAAIHVQKPVERWSTCGTAPGWTYNSNRANLPRDSYPYIIEHIKVVIYNGDWDTCVPYTDNVAWTSGMNYPTKAAWHPWFYNVTAEGVTSEQVGGYATVYDKNDFTFVTVRGGRHEVPETAPDKALALLSHLIHGVGF